MLHHEERIRIKEKIEANIERLKEDIEDLKALTKPISPDNAYGRVSRMDAINSRSVNEAALRSSVSKLSKLEHALTLVDKPDFGICTKCRQPIQIGRLMLMPESSRCIRCA